VIDVRLSYVGVLDDRDENLVARLLVTSAGALQNGGGRGGTPAAPGAANDPNGAISPPDAINRQLGLKLELKKRRFRMEPLGLDLYARAGSETADSAEDRARAECAAGGISLARAFTGASNIESQESCIHAVLGDASRVRLFLRCFEMLARGYGNENRQEQAYNHSDTVQRFPSIHVQSPMDPV
jgi:hypothetical protein